MRVPVYMMYNRLRPPTSHIFTSEMQIPVVRPTTGQACTKHERVPRNTPYLIILVQAK